MINAKTVEELCKRLEDACTGHPHAKIAWPHRLLHEAAARIRALTAENEAMRRERDEARESLHLANGTADLAIKHRDAAEKEAAIQKALVAELREKVERCENALADAERLREAKKRLDQQTPSPINFPFDFPNLI